jgi:hypothetical protein
MKQHFWSPADVELELAWVPPQHRLVEPVRATPLYESFSGTIWNSVVESYPAPIDPHLVTAEVTLHHPDVGPMKALVAFDDLRGPWYAEPLESLVEATGWNPRKTWAQIAEERYAWTMEQRDLADRLTALGVSRCRRNYAGQGGTSMDAGRQTDTKLMFTHKELLQIVQLAERGNT